MREQLQLLMKLQTIDLRVSELEKLKDEPSSKISQLEATLLEKEKDIEHIKKQFEESTKKKIKKEKDLDVELEKIKASEKRMMEAKTNKEYEAFLKEIAFAKELNLDAEEEIIEYMNEIEEISKKIVQLEANCTNLAKNFKKEKVKLKSDSIKYGKEMKSFILKRKDIVNAIKADLFEQYNIIREKRLGIAVVNVTNGICQGCHLNILPQLYNDVQKCEDLIVCPHCLRILYWSNNQ